MDEAFCNRFALGQILASLPRCSELHLLAGRGQADAHQAGQLGAAFHVLMVLDGCHGRGESAVQYHP